MNRSTVLSIVLSGFGLLATSPAAFSAPKVIINQATAPCTITPNAGTVFTMGATGDVLVNGTYGSDCPKGSDVPQNPSFSPFSPTPADLAITPNSTVSAGGPVTPSFTAYFANTCNGQVTASAGCPAVSGAWGSGGVVCNFATNLAGQKYCSPSGTVTMPANTAATACTYTFKAMSCTNGTTSVNSSTAVVTVPGTSTPPNCLPGDTSGDMAGFTRQCSGGLSDNATPARNGTWTDFTSVYGAWPGSQTNAGKTQKLTINQKQYASLQFIPTQNTAIGLTSNETFMSQGGLMSVTTAPGYFNPGPHTICSTGRGTTIGAAPSVGCPLTAGSTYYINFASVDQLGNALCANSSCLAAWTFQITQ